jgi:hypothetical protein
MAMPSSSHPASHRWIAIAALVWNLLGLMAFVMQVVMSPEQVAALPPEDRAVYEATPSWLTAAFALAVGGGVVGSIGLLLRRRWAITAFAVSLAALVVQIAGAYLTTPLWQASGATGAVMPVLLLAIGGWLLRHAQRATA